MLTASQKSYLATHGDRHTLDPVERMLYSHDAGALPSMMRLMVGSPVCDAVVQPESEAEVAKLLSWADREGIPLTPRGKATSGYGGGVIPARKGVVVDFYRMRSVVSIDVAGKTATVPPGITWEQLDRALMKKGLTLRLYPTSYMSSTVGGWLAQGGAGIGSHQYGYFIDNVVSARIVDPSGSVKEVSGEALRLIDGAEGTTGFITEITIEVKALEDQEVIAVSAPSARGLQALIEYAVETDLPIWNILFKNPAMAKLKNKAPLRIHNGRPAGERVEVPEACMAVMTIPSSQADAVRSAVERKGSELGLTVLSDKIARHEWHNRCNLMVVKRMGPSLVPAEVIVPVAGLAPLMDRIEGAIGHPVVKEGVVVKKGRDGKAEAVILGFIPADERGTIRYHLLFALSASVLRTAERFGGRAYSTGLYFASKARDVFGAASFVSRGRR